MNKNNIEKQRHTLCLTIQEMQGMKGKQEK